MPAVIDVGSHTVRLLIGAWSEGALRITTYQQTITHLGEQASPSTGLAPEAMARTLNALEGFATLIRTQGDTCVRVLGTQALRAAPNRSLFAQQLRQRTGLVLEVIDGQQEALLTAGGVLSALRPLPSRCIICDIGGGSTELVCVEQGRVLFSHSWPVGVVGLLRSANPEHVISSFCSDVQRQLSSHELWPHAASSCWTLVGTAGTITTLAAMHQNLSEYQPQKITNYVLTVQQLQAMQAQLLPLTVSQRERLPGIEPGRGATLMPGVSLLLRLMAQLEQKSLVVCDAGLLQGAFCAAWGDGPLLSSIN